MIRILSTAMLALIAVLFVAPITMGSCSCGDPAPRVYDAAVCHPDAAPTAPDASASDARVVDAALPTDAAVDATPLPPDARVDAGIDAGNVTPCVSRGDGRDGAQCCAWDPAACRAGLGCYWMPGNETGPEDALCVSPNGTLGPDRVCEYERFMDCQGGTFCLGLTHQAPDSTTGFCRLICDPRSTSPGCPAGETCDVITSNPSIGFCGGNL